MKKIIYDLSVLQTDILIILKIYSTSYLVPVGFEPTTLGS